jgi:hypothetical protein
MMKKEVVVFLSLEILAGLDFFFRFVSGDSNSLKHALVASAVFVLSPVSE